MRRVVWLAPFAAWCVLVGALLPRHEPWFDETHAWMLARGSGFAELFIERLRYEGTPGLWHALLWPFAHAGLPFQTVQILGAVSAALGALLVFWLAPLPWPLRLLVPFAYFFSYQYAVVARSYCLLLPLGVLTALAFHRRMERPLAFAGTAIVLANATVYGTAIAGALVAAYAVDVARGWSGLDAPRRRRHVAAIAAFLGLLPLLAAQLWPAPDQSFGPITQHGFIGSLNQAWSLIDGGLGGTATITLPLLAATFYWLARRRAILPFAFALFALAMVFIRIRGAAWHQGAVLVAWLVAVWISFIDAAPAERRSRPALALSLAAAAMLVNQARWTAASYLADWSEPYSGSQAAGRWLAEQGLDDEPLFAVGFAAYAVLPYLRIATFANAQDGRPYYVWTYEEDARHSLKAALEERPEWVLLAHKWESGTLPGYDEVATFPGANVFKGRTVEDDSYSVLRRHDEGRTAEVRLRVPSGTQ